MAVSTAEDSDVLSEINITPLVDVMLVLLVAFVDHDSRADQRDPHQPAAHRHTTPPEQQKAITVTVDTPAPCTSMTSSCAQADLERACSDIKAQHRRTVAASARRRARALWRGRQGDGSDRARRHLQGLGTHGQRINPWRKSRHSRPDGRWSPISPLRLHDELDRNMNRSSLRCRSLALSLALLAPSPARRTAAAPPRSRPKSIACTLELERRSRRCDRRRNAAPDGTSATARPKRRTPQDTALGKVTVRARNRLEPLQEVPLSISVVPARSSIGSRRRKSAPSRSARPTCRGTSATSAPVVCPSAASAGRARPRRRIRRWASSSTA